MTISAAQVPNKLSLDEIIEAIKQLSVKEYGILLTKLTHIGSYEMQPMPYVVQIEPGKSFEQTLRDRGFNGTNWVRVDEIVKDIDMPEIIVELD